MAPSVLLLTNSNNPGSPLTAIILLYSILLVQFIKGGAIYNKKANALFWSLSINLMAKGKGVFLAGDDFFPAVGSSAKWSLLK
jgi:hypothetical protein